jgi:hypothetical protein
MKPTNNNRVTIIHPYVYNGQWVFDDESRGLDKEAFVSGADSIMDMLYLAAHGSEAAFIPEGAQFSLCFSDTLFKGHQYQFNWVEDNGMELYDDLWTLYTEATSDISGWLCPALLTYFPEPPKKIYVEATPHMIGRAVSNQILSAVK